MLRSDPDKNRTGDQTHMFPVLSAGKMVQRCHCEKSKCRSPIAFCYHWKLGVICRAGKEEEEKEEEKEKEEGEGEGGGGMGGGGRRRRRRRRLFKAKSEEEL
jgi:hypothetical protein